MNMNLISVLVLAAGLALLLFTLFSGNLFGQSGPAVGSVPSVSVDTWGDDVYSVAVAPATVPEVVTAAAFYDVLASNDHVMVQFYAPWCGHCKKFAPAYIEAAAKIEDAEFVRFDCTADATFCSDQQINGQYPTVKWFHNGEFVNDVTARDVAGLTEFATSQIARTKVEEAKANIFGEEVNTSGTEAGQGGKGKAKGGKAKGGKPKKAGQGGKGKAKGGKAEEVQANGGNQA